MDRKTLKEMYEAGTISKEKYGTELIKLEEMPKESKEKRIYEGVTYEQFIKLMQFAKKIKHKIAYILAYGSGLRISEVLNLKPEDVDLKAHKLFIRQAKGNKDRIVNTPKWLKPTHLNFLPLKITARGLDYAFHTQSKLAGFNSIIYTDKRGTPRCKYHFHSLRSGYAIRALEKGVPIHHLQILLGHENLATTSRYTKANPIDAIQSILDKDV